MIIHRIERLGADLPRRVAAYCRVSTNREKQAESYETQQAYYTRQITSFVPLADGVEAPSTLSVKANNSRRWELAGIYADQGITGTDARKRPEFMRMIADATAARNTAEQKIHIILCKSISRFSRNVVDAQRYVELLKDYGVEVRFEKEGISSFDPAGRFIFSLMAAVAEDESRSISENIRWTYREMQKRGYFNLGSNRMLGYDTDPRTKKLVPNRSAWIVREVFTLFSSGVGVSEIARRLNGLGAKRLRSDRPFSAACIQRLLCNETYVGDKCLQKANPTNFLTKRPDPAKPRISYYLENDHQGIVDRRTWEAVQARLGRER